MPVPTPLKKVLFAGAAVAAFGGGLYWQFGRPAPAPADTAAVPLLKRPLGDLGLPPDDREALAGAEALFRQGRYAEALARLDRFGAKDGGPGHLRATLVAARCLLNLGNYPEAERAFRYVADERPDDPDAHRGLATVYEFLGSSAQETHLKRVAELDPADPKPLQLLAGIYLDLKDYERAAEAAREGLKRNPPPAAAAALRRDLADALVGQNQFPEAVDALAGDDAPPARAVRAEALRMLTRRDEAEREVAAGLADPAADAKTRARLLVQRGWVRIDARDDAGAAAAFAEVLRHDEHHLAARLQYAQALRRLGQTARADAEEAKFKDSEARLKRVAELYQEALGRPWDGAVRRQLADAYRAVNMPAMADHWLAAAAACDAKK